METSMSYEYDAFICHATEDKEKVARPLAEALTALGFQVWYDETTLRIGDNLRRKIEEGLAKSRYGVVILSEDFFKKEWPKTELDGLLAREMADAVKVILPIWHGVDAKKVRQFSLPLSMRLAGNTANGIVPLAAELSEIFGVAPESVVMPEISDELSVTKQRILVEALKQGTFFLVVPASSSGGKCLQINGLRYRESEKQRKLFLYALEQLVAAGLVESLSETAYELTYTGMQAAERMDETSLIPATS